MGGEEFPTTSVAFGVQLLCSVGIAASYYITRSVYGFDFTTDAAARVLALFLAIEGPLVIGLYSLVRDAPRKCGYWKAVGRGLLTLPVGALLNAFVAVILGAPVGMEHWAKTRNWSLLMSLFIFVPASCVFGSSKEDWLRLLVHSKTSKRLDYMVSLPAHGAVLGGWVGAWPMPLDWERPWQEWPICVTYGAVGGYLLGMLASFALIFRGNTRHDKSD